MKFQSAVLLLVAAPAAAFTIGQSSRAGVFSVFCVCWLVGWLVCLALSVTIALA